MGQPGERGYQPEPAWSQERQQQLPPSWTFSLESRLPQGWRWLLAQPDWGRDWPPYATSSSGSPKRPESDLRFANTRAAKPL
jgi:hypothetical protein